MTTKRLSHRAFAGALAALVLTLLGTSTPAIAGAGATTDDIEAPVETPAGSFDGVDFVQYDGVFVGTTSTGAFRVPYRITAPANPAQANGAVVVEAPHFATGLGTLEFQIGRAFLLGRGFVHAGVGYSTTSFGPGWDQRILDPSVPGTYVLGGFTDGNGRTDDEIVADFALALANDSTARDMIGDVNGTYVTGFSDAANVVLRLVESGQADGVFELAFPFTAEGPFDPQAALTNGKFQGKVVIVNSAAEDSTNLFDGDANQDRYRFYAVAGTPHVSDPMTITLDAAISGPSSISGARSYRSVAGR